MLETRTVARCLQSAFCPPPLLFLSWWGKLLSTHPEKVSMNTNRYLYPYLPGFTSVKSTSQQAPGLVPHSLIPWVAGWGTAFVSWHALQFDTMSPIIILTSFMVILACLIRSYNLRFPGEWHDAFLVILVFLVLLGGLENCLLLSTTRPTVGP